MCREKDSLRKQLKQVRLALTSEQRKLKSGEIAKLLKTAIDWNKVNTIHYFEPIESLGEVDVGSLAADKQVFTSRKINNDWQVVAIDGGDVPQKFDVIVVPMLGFDTSLNRIGYGGGYYDRLLADHPEAQKIGVCFEAGKVNQIPIEEHDVALDVIVTELGAYAPDSTPKGV